MINHCIDDIMITKSSAIEGINAKIIKLVFQEPKRQLVHIFNWSMQKGVVPSAWKCGNY